MTGAVSWETIAAMAGTVSALVGPPLAVVIHHVRVLREDQRTTQRELGRRIEQLDGDVRRMERSVEDVQRAYTTKDEWLRETMLARRQLERLSELLARLQADMENVRGLTGQFGRAVNAIVEVADRLAGRG